MQQDDRGAAAGRDITRGTLCCLHRQAARRSGGLILCATGVSTAVAAPDVSIALSHLLSSPGHLVCCWGQYAKISFGVSIQRSAAHVTSARREGLGLMEAQLNGIRLVWDEVGR